MSNGWDALFRQRKREPKMRSQEFLEWVERNPLRIWRHKWGLSYQGVKDQFSKEGIPAPSRATIYAWEVGDAVPHEDNFLGVARIMGVDHHALAGEWYKWLQERPEE
jgi:hypothetical protein